MLTSDSESLSNAILEAMAARLPVVAYNVGGNAELINDERGELITRRMKTTSLMQSTDFYPTPTSASNRARTLVALWKKILVLIEYAADTKISTGLFSKKNAEKTRPMSTPPDRQPNKLKVASSPPACATLEDKLSRPTCSCASGRTIPTWKLVSSPSIHHSLAYSPGQNPFPVSVRFCGNPSTSSIFGMA